MLAQTITPQAVSFGSDGSRRCPCRADAGVDGRLVCVATITGIRLTTTRPSGAISGDHTQPTDEAAVVAVTAAPRGIAVRLAMVVVGVGHRGCGTPRLGALVLVLPPLVTGCLFAANAPVHGEPLTALLGSSLTRKLMVLRVNVGRVRG